MNCGDDDLSPPFVSAYSHGPYSSSIASSASSSSASVWSDAASQSSDDSSVHSGGSDTELPGFYTSYKNASTNASAHAANWAQANTATTTEHRSHPRRTSGAPRAGPPSLVRQCDRKVTFVDGLVDSSAQIVEAIWPLSSVVCRTEMGSKGVLPLRTFIQETLRRSRTSYSTLQVALYYLILIKAHVPQHDFTMEQPVDDHCNRALQCGRRMFLAALILASKYLQDRNYSARAWSKICGLNTIEINRNETAFLLAVNWKLHITETVFQKWSDIMLRFTSNKPGGPSAIRSCSDAATWKAIVVQLTPELDNMDYILASPSVQARPCKPTACFTRPVAFGRGNSYDTGSQKATPTPSTYAPHVLEPTLPIPYSGSQMAPAYGLLPTPRMTPQSSGYNTPAVGATSYMLGRSAMGFAMSQASSVIASHATERWQNNVSPLGGLPSARRSSLATSVSSMSSPESMVSDSSSRSRSSSVSSASSSGSVRVSSKLDIQARCRYAKQCSEGSSKTVITTVHENYTDDINTLSPESYAGPVGEELLPLAVYSRNEAEGRRKRKWGEDECRSSPMGHSLVVLAATCRRPQNPKRRHHECQTPIWV